MEDVEHHCLYVKNKKRTSHRVHTIISFIMDFYIIVSSIYMLCDLLVSNNLLCAQRGTSVGLQSTTSLDICIIPIAPS